MLKDSQEFVWSQECEASFEFLKRKLVEESIIWFQRWSIKFHVHIYASSIEISVILTHLVDDGKDYHNAYSRRNLNKGKMNYSTKYWEALDLIFELKKYRNYLLANTFIFYTNHQTLKYFVNKPIRHGQICLGILLFQEFEFEIIVQPGKPNVSPDHLSIIETSE